jgi:hypothetical protein
MPIGIGAGTAIAGIVGGGAALTGAALQSHAAGSAADKQTAAANHAADVEAQSNREALAFQKQQAAYQAQQDEVNRRANYDQWAAKQRKVGSIGQMLGLGGTEIPAYVPGGTPDFGTMVDASSARPRVGPRPAGAPVPPGGMGMPFGAAAAGGTPAPGGPPSQDANDFLPRDPRTGAILRPRLLSFGDYAA